MIGVRRSLLAACVGFVALAFGSTVAEAAPPAAPPPLDERATASDEVLTLLGDALTSLRGGDIERYDDVVDQLDATGEWLPDHTWDALELRDEDELVFSYLILASGDTELLTEARNALVEEQRDLALVAPTDTSDTEALELIRDADRQTAGVYEVMQHRDLQVSPTVERLLDELPSVDDPTFPTTADYDRAIVMLTSRLAGEPSPLSTVGGPAASGDAGLPAAPEPVARTTTGRATQATDPVARESATASSPDDTTIPPIGAGDTSGTVWIAIGAALVALLGVGVALFAVVRGRRHDHLAGIAFTDGLTGLNNRRRFDADVIQRVALAERPTAMLMIDVDHFKSFNDTHGHSVGDEVLRLVGAAIRSTVRRDDIPYRYGGEEFSVLLPETDRNDAIVVAERVRASIAAIDLPVDASVTASVGVSVGPSAGLNDTIERADSALYDAKRLGRDCVSAR